MSTSKLLDPAFYHRQPDIVAVELLGKVLVVCRGEACRSCAITESEAYFGECDPASRARRGRGRIWRSLYGPQGVILVYGMHRQWLLNIVAHEPGMAGAVLLRSCKPLHPPDLSPYPKGPGRLSRALGVTRDLDGLPVYTSGSPVRVEDWGLKPSRIARGGRIGVSEDLEIPLRFTALDL